MQTLIIQHIEKSDPPSFNVIRGSDNKKLGGPYDVPSPIGYPVKDRPNSDLMHELRWYLEDFLEYPYSPKIEQAENVQNALREWGSEAFNALFNNRDAGSAFEKATENGYKKL